MNNYIEVPITLELSGYSRGFVTGTAYYDPETKTLVDWDYNLSSYDVVRNDMEADSDYIPQKLIPPILEN